jgi:3'(2'), 5'-bisphosphate nucleotidase
VTSGDDQRADRKPAADEDHVLAATLAEETGRLLLALRERLTTDHRTPAELKAEGDRAAHEHLVAALARLRPDDPVCSEEAPGSRELDLGGVRTAAPRVWIVDPLDGTREYGQGRDDWAVHVALAIGGRPAVGAVALPSMGVVLSTAAPPTLPPLDPGRLAAPRILVSRSRPPREASVIADALGGELVPMGSAGAKAMAVVRGAAEVYPHSGGQYVWDNCAPAAVALAAGLTCTRLDGSPLRYDDPDPFLPDLLVCRPELTTLVHEALSA